MKSAIQERYKVLILPSLRLNELISWGIADLPYSLHYAQSVENNSAVLCLKMQILFLNRSKLQYKSHVKQNQIQRQHTDQ